MNEGRSPAFYALAAFFGLFVLFLYGPTIVIFILSFQGPTGRPHLSDERRLDPLVRQALARRRHRRYFGARSSARWRSGSS